ncbi:MAG TPA: hypothetical protein VNJ71_05385 [Gemmatimonadales bacterium]|jgi:aspartokinase-like uncharacterized kinase|nr:hypothetical protein [Gemmatimonadales bacterium]
MRPGDQATAPTGATGLAVVKVGGSLARLPGALERVGKALAQARAGRPIVVIPGGGPFADTVREFDRRSGLSPDAAHWMAILAMDQFGYVLGDRIPGGLVVTDAREVAEALQRHQVPILAPARWLRAADELPHRWEVTSDSLAAYLAVLLGADELVLVKPVAGGRELLDPYFSRAAAAIPWSVVGLEEVDGLAEKLRAS